MKERHLLSKCLFVTGAALTATASCLIGDEHWVQFKGDSRRSGDAPEHGLEFPLSLVGAIPMSDAVFTSPVVADGRVFVIDGSGVVHAINADTLEVEWRHVAGSGGANCNNICTPAYAAGFLHVGTMAGSYLVLEADTGKLREEIRTKEPIFSAPVVSAGRVYFATLGSRVHALKPDGSVLWRWDYVKECLGFDGDRWSGAEWLKFKKGQRLGPVEQFHCSREMAAFGNTLVIPTGGALTWLEDAGDRARLVARHVDGCSTLGLSMGEKGEVLRQWHRLDNGGTVQIYPLDNLGDGKATKSGDVPGTLTNWNSVESLSFSSVSVRGDTIYRCRPEAGFGLCRHRRGGRKADPLGSAASISSPILAGDTAIYGGLDGRLHCVPLGEGGKPWAFRTAFGEAITAPVAVAGGRVYFGCDDGYLYVLGPGGAAALPTERLELTKIRSELAGDKSGSNFDRFTSFADWSNSNSNDQGVKPPFKLKWIRRFEGTTKHFTTFGGGRMYTHTAEGQVFAVEQETGRLLWRRFFPGVHNSYTSPLYHRGKILVPQAGFDHCRLRCLDAGTGRLDWEAPFGGSPSWNRQLPPVAWEDLVIYMFGTGKYGHRAAKDEEIPWLFEHQDNPRFPRSHEPVLVAFDRGTGRVVWKRSFAEYGSGGDEAGVCLMDGVLYYSAFFGHSPLRPSGGAGDKGVTAAIDPATGELRWVTTKHWMNGGCTISAADGRLYLGGYNPVGGTRHRYVWCLDARDGSLIWRSEPLLQAIQVVTVGPRFLFVHAQYKDSYLLDKGSGKIASVFSHRYKCTRFTLSDPYLAASNMDVIDLRDVKKPRLISTGPRLDPSDCVGAVFSNGRMFYTGQGGGLQGSQVWGRETKACKAAWE